jgi:predicted metal-binding protein
VSGRIFVCLTCNRYARPAPGEIAPGRRMADALTAQARGLGRAVTVRTVECLNGCPNPCIAALRTPGKCLIRLSGLVPEDAPALLELAERYAESPSGNLDLPQFPEALRDKVSLRIPVLGNAL